MARVSTDRENRPRGRFSLLHFGDDSFEYFRVFLGYRCEHFSVQENVFLFERVHELAVRKSVRANGGADARLPNAAEIRLLVLAVGECVLTGVKERFARLALLG